MKETLGSTACTSVISLYSPGSCCKDNYQLLAQSDAIMVLIVSMLQVVKHHVPANRLFPNKPSPAVSQRAPLAPPGYVTPPVPAGWRPVVAMALRLGFNFQRNNRHQNRKFPTRLFLLARSLAPWLGAEPYCHDRHIPSNEQHSVDQESTLSKTDKPSASSLI